MTQKKKGVNHQFTIEEGSLVEIIFKKGEVDDSYVSMSSKSVIEALSDYFKKISLKSAKHSSLIPSGKLEDSLKSKTTP